MILKERLLTIANLVKPNSVVADIGCDHGYLLIYLTINKIIKYGYGIEINDLPLENCRKNIIKYSLANKITLIKGDGIGLLPIDANILTIAGMGGKLIIDIIKKNFAKLKNIQALILCPNNNEYYLRQQLNLLNFTLKKEKLVKENNIIYTVFLYTIGKEIISEKELIFGKSKQENYELFYQYWHKEIIHLSKILNKIPSNKISARQKIQDKIDNIYIQLKGI